METQNAVMKEIKYIALGCAVGTLLMLGIFAVLGKFDQSVLLGGLYGCVLAIANFFVLGLTVKRLADKAEESRKPGSEEIDPDVINAAKLKIRGSYYIRMIVGIALLILAFTVFKFNWIACMVPLIFPRIVIMIRQFGQRAGNIKGSDIK